MSFVERLHWRAAVQTFDTTKPLQAADLEKILEAARMAPTSNGLQPFHVHVVSDAETKEKLGAAGYRQKQWTTAPVTLVFTSRHDVGARITDYMDLAAGGDPARREALGKFEGSLRRWAERLSEEQIFEWASRQAYIALGFAMAACAELGIDSCPMEGFVPAEFDSILGLPPGRKSVVALSIGYRDTTVKVRDKLRFSEKDLFTQGVFKK